MDKVMRMSSEKGVVIFTKSSCCLCYTVQILFRDLRVQPTIHEIDNDPDCREIEKALLRIGCSTAVPAVFVGGKLTTRSSFKTNTLSLFLTISLNEKRSCGGSFVTPRLRDPREISANVRTCGISYGKWLVFSSL
ncbi:hypothetical protein F2Q68_00028519 [Brassica cretica]|uniref:Glutaredoxin domain-containing protein n=1 Tax=Brassica cretica TaxID=69181 RepID=A0A8S9I9C2_BRACR|nr:hypothetical protein F2Q68_00028519 [Brassica cretica]